MTFLFPLRANAANQRRQKQRTATLCSTRVNLLCQIYFIPKFISKSKLTIYTFQGSSLNDLLHILLTHYRDRKTTYAIFLEIYFNALIILGLLINSSKDFLYILGTSDFDSPIGSLKILPEALISSLFFASAIISPFDEITFNNNS